MNSSSPGKTHLPACGKKNTFLPLGSLTKALQGSTEGVRAHRGLGARLSPASPLLIISQVLLPPSQLPVGSQLLRTSLVSEECREQRARHRHTPETNPAASPEGGVRLCSVSKWLRGPWDTSAVCPCSHRSAPGAGIASRVCLASLTPNLCCVGCLHAHMPALQVAETSALCHFSDPEGLDGAGRMGV